MRIKATALVLACFGLLQFGHAANAYQLEKRSEETFSHVHTITCEDGKVHWIRQEKKSGQWCYDSRCFNSVDDLIRSQVSSCK